MSISHSRESHARPRRTPRRSRLVWLSMLALVAGSFVSATAAAATVLRFDFDTADGQFEQAADTHVASITVGSWLDSAGSLSDFTGVEGRSAGARDWLDGNSFRLLFAVHPGYTLTLEGVEFMQRASASGPSHWIASIYENDIGQGTTSTSFQDASFAVAGMELQGLVSFALTGTGASSNSGTWRIDDFALIGQLTAVPLPAAAPAFVLALLGCFRQKRRIS